MPESFTFDKNRTPIAGLLPGFVRLNSGLVDTDGIPVPAVDKRLYTTEQRVAHGFALRMLKPDGYCNVGIFRPKYRINDNDYRLDRFGDSDVVQEYVTPSNFQDAIAIPVYRNKNIKDLMLVVISPGGTNIQIYGFINKDTNLDTKRKAHWDLSTSSGWTAPSGAKFDKFLCYSMNQLYGDNTDEVTFAVSREGYEDRFYVFSARNNGTARIGITVSVPDSVKILKVFIASKPENQDFCGIVLYRIGSDALRTGYFRGSSTTVYMKGISNIEAEQMTFVAVNVPNGVVFVGNGGTSVLYSVKFSFDGSDPDDVSYSMQTSMSLFPLRGFEYPASTISDRAYMLGIVTNGVSAGKDILVVELEYSSRIIDHRRVYTLPSAVYKPVQQITPGKFVAADSTLFWQDGAYCCAQYLAKQDGTNDYFVCNFFIRPISSSAIAISSNINKLLPIPTNSIPIGMHTFSDLLSRS
jgi:hypothetical protein